MTDDTPRLQAELRAALDRIANLEIEVRALRTEVGRLGAHGTAEVPEAVRSEAECDESEPSTGPPALDRRRLLTRGGTAAVGALLGGAAATVATASPAAAATGSFDSSTSTPALTLSNTASTQPGGSALTATAASTSATADLVNTGGGSALALTGQGPRPTLQVNASDGIAAVDVEASGASVAVYAIGKVIGVAGDTASANGAGVRGRATTPSGAGVVGEASNGSTGVLGTAADGVGVRAIGTVANLLLRRFDADPAVPAPPSTTAAHQAGEIVYDDQGTYWACIADGTPGVWVRLAAAGTAGTLTMLPAPTRVYDTRVGSGLPGAGTGPVAGVRKGVDLTANSSGVPTDATAAVATLTVTDTVANPAAYGQIYANGLSTPPTTSSINWTTANSLVATTTTTAITNGKVAISMNPGANVLIDVLGYYR